MSEFKDQQNEDLRKIWQDYWACEKSIVNVKATVLTYDEVQKKWIWVSSHSSTSEISQVHIYQHTLRNSFRIVGRKLANNEVVLNVPIFKELNYYQATETFHQWRYEDHVFGLFFSSQKEADLFASTMQYSLNIVQNLVSSNNETQIAIQQTLLEENPQHTRKDDTIEQTIIMALEENSNKNEELIILYDQGTNFDQHLVAVNEMPPGSLECKDFTAPVPPPLPPTNKSNLEKTGTIGSIVDELRNVKLRPYHKNLGKSAENISSVNCKSPDIINRRCSVMDEMSKILAKRKVTNNNENEQNIDIQKSHHSNNTLSCKTKEKYKEKEMHLTSEDLENLKQEIIKVIKEEVTQLKKDIVEIIERAGS